MIVLFDENQANEPLLPEDRTFPKGMYDTLQNSKNVTNMDKNTTGITTEQRDCTREHNNTFERFTILETNTAEVEQDDYHIDKHSRTSSNAVINESEWIPSNTDINESEWIPNITDINESDSIPNITHCTLTHWICSCNKQINFLGRRGKFLACFVFWFVLVSVIASATVFVLLKKQFARSQQARYLLILIIYKEMARFFIDLFSLNQVSELL